MRSLVVLAALAGAAGQTGHDALADARADASFDHDRGAAGRRAHGLVSGSEGRNVEQWRRAIANDRTDRLVALLATARRRSGETAETLGSLANLGAGNGKTALMVAAKAGNLALARDLVAAGAAVDRRTATDGTAFMFAALGNTLEVARWLYARGAALEQRGSNGWTVLTIAAARGFEPMVEWLLAIGADPAPVDVYGFTPMMRAVENGHAAVARRLIEASPATIDSRDEYDNTALHHAAALGRRDLVEALLAAGSDPDLANREGLTSRDIARERATLDGVVSAYDTR